jgi:hypothetical protein
MLSISIYDAAGRRTYIHKVKGVLINALKDPKVLKRLEIPCWPAQALFFIPTTSMNGAEFQ